jgi:hypothetical protein
MARIFNAVKAENPPPRRARGDIKQTLRIGQGMKKVNAQVY